MSASEARKDVVDAASGKLRAMMLPSGQDQLIKRSSSSALSSARHLPSTPVAIPPYPPSIPSSSDAAANFQVVINVFYKHEHQTWLTVK